MNSPRRTQHRWTNASVLAFAGGQDPIAAITDAARNLVAKALDHGWSGPPYDPLELARLLRLEVMPRSDVRDAQTVPLPKGRFRLEFNPTRPAARVRYSLAHEIAH